MLKKLDTCQNLHSNGPVQLIRLARNPSLKMIPGIILTSKRREVIIHYVFFIWDTLSLAKIKIDPHFLILLNKLCVCDSRNGVLQRGGWSSANL